VSHSGTTVSVIDIGTETIVDTVPVGQGPNGVTSTLDSAKVYVANQFSHSVSVIETTNDTVINTLPINTPNFVVVNPDGTKAYVSSNPPIAIDTNTDSITIVNHPGSGPFAFTPDGNKMYITGGVSEVSVIDVVNDSLITTVPVGTSPRNVAITPAVVEGPPGDPTCSDGIDNDGDGFIDLDDFDCTAFLSFPLRGSMPGVDEGLTPYTATITSVFDHSQPQRFPYKVDNVVTTYTGEQGEFVRGDPVQGCVSPVSKKLFGFKNMDGASFMVNDHYSGGGTTCASRSQRRLTCNPSSCDTFLFYDGHPGIDYRATGGVNCPSGDIGTEVYAVVDGTIHYPRHIPGLRNARFFTTLELRPDEHPEYMIYYLHLSTHPTLMNEIMPEGTHVNSGDLIGRTGCGGPVPVDPHLHFEVQKNDIPVDPYGWEGETPDPYSRETNIRLWK